RQLEKELVNFTQQHPNPRIIIVLRKHSDWIRSHYKRVVKNGFSGQFSEFYSSGLAGTIWKREDLELFPKIKMIEKYSVHKPLVLLYTDLLADASSFIDSICLYTTTKINQDAISFEKVHTSYSENQLLVVRRFSQFFRIGLKSDFNHGLKNWLFFRPWWILFHLVLYTGRLVPSRFISKQPLISKEELKQIDLDFGEDWGKVLDYVDKQNLIANTAATNS
ncbi:MAG: hypothetical protein AAF789_14305, partial [Bacteroidota bacterium]